MQEIHTQSSFMDNFFIFNIILMVFFILISVYVPFILFKIYRILKEIKKQIENNI